MPLYFHSMKMSHNYGDVTIIGNLGTVFEQIDRVAKHNIPVLIHGETGTGKELVAKAIHYAGDRRELPFVPVNTSAIPESLLESELYGHVKGAFTGAYQDRKGRFEEADGGSLFLDEIGDMPKRLQVKLLRVLQDGYFARVGDNKLVHTDSRVVAATNQDLNRMIRTGEFREDLYYRLNAFPIYLPPLRERKKDIKPLAKHFVEKYSPEDQEYVLTSDFMEALSIHDWPGNVRELENVVRRAMVMSDGELRREHFPMEVVDNSFIRVDIEMDGSLKENGLQETMDDIERRVVERALEITNGKVSPAARLLKVSRPTFYDKIKKYGLDID